MRAQRFWAGVVAGAALVVVELLARVLAGVPTVPELIQDRLVLLLPGPVFSFVLDQLYYLGKPLLFGSLLVAQVLLGGLGGLLARKRHEAAGLAVVAWLLTNLVVFPLAGQQVFGGSVAEALVTLAAFAVYAGGLIAFGVSPALENVGDRVPRRATGSMTGRRQVLGGALLVLLGVALGRRVIGTLPSFPGSSTSDAALPSSADTSGAASGSAGLPSPVTSPQDFYEVSKNIADPTVDGTTWQLQIDGLVNQPQTLTLDAVQALPAQEREQTLECISNDVGGDLISNGQWRGVRLADVLAQAGLQAGAGAVNFTSADGYTESLPLNLATDPQVLLVYQLDGQPLPTQHGYPLRVLTTGTYGMKNPKWLTHIQVVDKGEEGYWEQQGWDPSAPIQTMSRIDTPKDGSSVSGQVTLGGVAFAGNRGIQRVEVSLDGGQTWADAQLLPAQSPLTWVLWEYPWSVAAGAATLAVTARATDGTGQVQSAQPLDSYPSGAAGLQTIHLHSTA